MTFHTKYPGVPQVRTQCWNLDRQLAMGIRFFDIRCRNMDDGLPIYHGVYDLDCDFKDVLEWVVTYLGSNPSEFVVMNVQQEGESDSKETIDVKVNRNLDVYPNVIYNGGSKNPTVAEMRGKIIVLAKYATSRPYLTWSDVQVENAWKNISKSDKMKAIKANLDEAQKTSNSESIFLTFTSRTDGLYSPRSTSREENPIVYKYMKKLTGRLGIVAMDYPGPGIIRRIIVHNRF